MKLHFLRIDSTSFFYGKKNKSLLITEDKMINLNVILLRIFILTKYSTIRIISAEKISIIITKSQMKHRIFMEKISQEKTENFIMKTQSENRGNNSIELFTF